MQQNSPNAISFLQIEPTTRCNFRCGFCTGRKLPQHDMSMEVFSSILNKISDIKHIELQGEGEPLLSEQFLPMLERLKTSHPQLAVSFITNGSLFSPEVIAKILCGNVKKILFSIESSDIHQYQRLRGGDITTLRNSIRSLISKRNESGQAHPRVGFAVTILRDTISSLPELVGLYTDLQMDGGMMVQLLQDMPHYVRAYSDEMRGQLLDQQQRDNLKKMIQTNSALQNAVKQEISSGGFYNALYGGKGTTWSSCPWLERGACITADGIMISCSFVKEREKYGFGRIDRDDLSLLLHRRKKLRRRLRAGIIPSNCDGCSLAISAVATKGRSRV